MTINSLIHNAAEILVTFAGVDHDVAVTAIVIGGGAALTASLAKLLADWI